MKFKKMALTLAASFALVACDNNGTEEQARRDAERAIADKMGAVEAVQQDQKALTTKLQQGQLPTTTETAPEIDLATLEKRADDLADRLNASSNPKADKQLGEDIRTFLVDTMRSDGITDAQFNGLTEKLDATKATEASGIIFSENMARNKKNCQRIIQRMERIKNAPSGVAAPMMSRCMNKR